jgi:hypothetical protein
MDGLHIIFKSQWCRECVYESPGISVAFVSSPSPDTTSSSSNVDVGRPSARRQPALPQSSDCVVQGVWHGCQVELSTSEDVRVHAHGDEWPVNIIHGPIKHLSIRQRRALPSDSPESSDYALEPDIQHGGCNVDGFVWLVRIHRCRLASTEIRKLTVRDVEAHEMA